MKYVLKNGKLFIGNGHIIENGNIIIEDSRITGLDTNNCHSKDCTVIDASGHTIFPGFIDCHVHICLDGTHDAITGLREENRFRTAYKASLSAQKTIMAGVTTIRDMGGLDHIDIQLRDAVNDGIITGPRMLVSGRLICMTGGHGWQIGGLEADGPDQIRRAVREQIKSGCDIIKFMATGGIITPGVEPGSPQLTFEELKAGIEEARKANKQIAAHTQSAIGTLNSLNAGIDTIEHGYGLTDEIITIMKKKNISLIPTLKAAFDLYDNIGKGRLNSFICKKIKMLMPKIIESVDMAIKSGLNIAMGTDAGVPFNQHGDNLIEIINLNRYGMSVNDAFQSATLIAAKSLGIDRELGSLQEGKIADIAVIRGDPLRDINILFDKNAVSFIMKEGRIIKNTITQ